MKKAFIPLALRNDDRQDVYSVLSMSVLSDLLLPFQAAKDLEYQSHWAKRGFLGYVHGCILRQTDRVEPGTEHLLSMVEFDETGEEIIPNRATLLAAASLMDTLVDVAIYALLGVCMLSSLFPEAGHAYKKKLLHRMSTGLDMPDMDLDLDKTMSLDDKSFAETVRQLADGYRKYLQ